VIGQFEVNAVDSKGLAFYFHIVAVFKMKSSR
jgi:hypothetical protein